MRKRKLGRKFSRKRDVRRAFLRSLLRSLVLRGRMQTTDARAREIRPLVEKLATQAKAGTLAADRRLASLLGKEVAREFRKMVKERFSDRQGGYTRIYKQEARKSDGARRAIIEFV